MNQLKLSIGFFLLLLSTFVQGGGIVTNTNQSVGWVRMLSRDASLEIDAAYSNPAGLTALGKGLFFSVSNQTIFSTRTIKNNYSNLNSDEYKGKIFAPIFPTIYGAYSTGKLVFSFGVNPVGGGGSAVYEDGLPSFEIPISDLKPSLASQGVTGYNMDVYFKGSSVFMGYQFGASYKINEKVSVYAGLRYVTAKNTYEGHLSDVNVTMGGTSVPAKDVLAGIAAQMNSMIGIPAALSPFPGTYTLAQAEAVGLPAANRTAIEQGLAFIGVPAANIPFMTIGQVQTAFTTATPTLTQNYYSASIKSKLLRNQQADVEQTGSGICPIIGVNITPNDKWNIGLKYEFATKMDVKNKTKLDFVLDSLPGQPATTMFPDGKKTPSDIPSLLSIGTSYKVLNNLKVSAGVHYYFDRNVNYGHSNVEGAMTENKDLINSNNYELSLGLEYNINEKLLLSTGYLFTNTGVKAEYNTDLSYSIPSHTLGFGGKYAISPKVGLELGVCYTEYVTKSKVYDRADPLSGLPISVTEKYFRNILIFAIGLNIKLSKGE